eukprot:jgi/Hompol1/2044/HPOL_005830-RA
MSVYSDFSIAFQLPLPFPSAQQFVAGACSGVAQTTIGHPLDLVKTRLQLGQFEGMAAPLAGISIVNAVLFTSYGWLRSIQVLRSHHQPQITSNWFSLSSASASTTPPNPPKPLDSVHQLSLSQIALAGAGGGVFYSFVATPIDRIKILLQAQRRAIVQSALPGQTAGNIGPLRIIAQTLREHGVRRGLFRGTTATILKEIP